MIAKLGYIHGTTDALDKQWFYSDPWTYWLTFVSFSAADQLAKLRYILRQARYYLIKSNNHENVALAKAKGVWSTPPQNEAKLNGAFKVGRTTAPNIKTVFTRYGDSHVKDKTSYL